MNLINLDLIRDDFLNENWNRNSNLIGCFSSAKFGTVCISFELNQLDFDRIEWKFGLISAIFTSDWKQIGLKWINLL